MGGRAGEVDDMVINRLDTAFIVIVDEMDDFQRLLRVYDLIYLIYQSGAPERGMVTDSNSSGHPRGDKWDSGWRLRLRSNKVRSCGTLGCSFCRTPRPAGLHKGRSNYY